MEDNAFIFRDGLGRDFLVKWDGSDSVLYFPRRSGHWLILRPVKPAELKVFMPLEIELDEYPLYDTRIEEIGRQFFLVKSNSRPDVVHVVDLEHNVFGSAPACSCEKNRFRKLKCQHIEEVEEFVRASSMARLGITPLQTAPRGTAPAVRASR
jgi:hypothetical protein